MYKRQGPRLYLPTKEPSVVQSGSFTKHNSTMWVYDWPSAKLGSKEYVYYQINLTTKTGAVQVLKDKIFLLRLNATSALGNDTFCRNRVVHVG